MMTGFIVPPVPQPFKLDGVTFTVRGLTAAEKLPIIFSAKGGGGRVEFGAAAFEHAVRCGLLGWDAAEPAWTLDRERNLTHLSSTQFIALGNKILDLTFMHEGDIKNSDSPSP